MTESNDESKKSLHWAEQLALQIIQAKPEPYVISGGLTTSGPTHLGTICELLFPQAIVNAIKYSGYQAKYYFVVDIFDAFDSIPSVFGDFSDILTEHLGKPLSDVPDPQKCHQSFGDHFFADAKEAAEKFGIAPTFVRATDLYRSGAFDSYAHLFLKNEEKVRKIVAQSSLRQDLPAWWSPIMPICQNCGKIATTRVLRHDFFEYEYVCDRDVEYVKGCGFAGKNKISDHQYKLTWRLHWPAWQDYFKTSAEGGGVDHFTRGGSRDTLELIFKEIFNKEPPIGYRWGFILFEGKKYSKSKGTGISVNELLSLLPPEVIKYVLLKPDIQENIDIRPTSDYLLDAILDFEKATGLLNKDAENLSRADRKKMLAAKLALEGCKIKSWKTSFLDLILYRGLQWNWERIAKETNDPAVVEFFRPYVEEWEKKKFIPEDYSFSYQPKKAEGPAKAYFLKLDAKMNALDIHNLAFNVAKEIGLPPADLFKECYLVLLGKPKGPKLGKLIEAIGIERIKQDVL
ncbi:MAG: lysine--tRNA ligase [Candidatus Micrarchaeota archaeon]|nr:lysine--tRNA ligase [Candidatus Micrarchaeota archaeon]